MAWDTVQASESGLTMASIYVRECRHDGEGSIQRAPERATFRLQAAHEEKDAMATPSGVFEDAAMAFCGMRRAETWAGRPRSGTMCCLLRRLAQHGPPKRGRDSCAKLFRQPGVRSSYWFAYDSASFRPDLGMDSTVLWRRLYLCCQHRSRERAGDRRCLDSCLLRPGTGRRSVCVL